MRRRGDYSRVMFFTVATLGPLHCRIDRGAHLADETGRKSMNRRGFLTALCAAMAAPDPDKLLWKPGAKLISVPSGHKLIPAQFWSIWVYGEVSKFSGYADYGVLGDQKYCSDFGIGGGSSTKTSRDIIEDVKYRLKNNKGRYKKAIWFVENTYEKFSGEIYA